MVVEVRLGRLRRQRKKSLRQTTPHSCGICKPFFLLYLHGGNRCPERGYWEPITDPEHFIGADHGYWFNLQFSQAVELAKHGCDLMTWLLTLRRPDTTPECYLRAYFMHNSEEQIALDFVHRISDHTDSKDFARKLVLCAEPDDLAADEIRSKLPNLIPSSIETMEKARKWLHTCINTHKMCPKPWSDQTRGIRSASETAKPQRLIKLCRTNPSNHLEGTMSLCLIETSNIPEPHYAALSYCWGGDQAIKLSKLNISSWLNSLPYTHLPQTIKDAAFVTAELGLEYLWIDALCIIQDDNADIAIELAKMADIYTQAQVTLLASRSASVEDGFLNSRHLPSEKSFRIPYMVKDGRVGSVVLWNGRDLGASEPIDQRGWCFQERLLSHRILEFGTHQTRYRCAANREAKHPTETDGWIAESETFESYGTGTSISFRNDWSSLEPEGEEFLNLWAYIVSHYSSLELSKSIDRLKAISAIARRFGKSSDTPYCVGLWQRHLQHLLLWKPRMDFGVKPEHSRINPYIAPSWSWASTTLPVEFEYYYSGPSSCQIVHIDIQNSTPGDRFSDAVDARLTIRAPTLAATLRWEEHRQKTCNSTPCAFGWGECDCENLEARNQSSHSGTHSVVLESEIDLSYVWCECEVPFEGRCDILLARITSSKGLVIRQLREKPERYERIGVFSDRARPLSDDVWKEMDFIIV